jgi:predicted lipoprotein
MKKSKKVLVATLALSIVTACSASPLAMSSRQFKQTIRDIVRSTGEQYEQNAETYPDAAVKNPTTAPADYLNNCVDYGVSFLDQIFGATGSYLG